MLLVTFLFLIVKTYGSASRQEISIYIGNDNSLNIQSGLDPKADVEATYLDEMTTAGWGKLEVQINQNGNDISDEQKMFAAGVAEGYLTSLGIYQTYINTYNVSGLWDFTNGPDDSLINYMEKQKNYMSEQISKNPTDPFWQYANLLNYQISGLQYGYNLTAKQNNIPTYEDSWPFEFLNLVGDLLDLMSALDVNERFDYHKYNNNDELLRALLKRGRCSALVKITTLIDNLFIGHSSWFIYENTNRIFKHYIFNFKNINTSSKHMMFSSYPGYLESLDDFYIMDNGIAMLQTTNGIPNTTLYDLVTPESLYAWQRVRISNALASNGQEWYKYISTANSGTYNNQYMVINYGIFVPNQPLPDNFLWVIEQIPGMVYGEDFTSIVERGYFASYNVPALELIYNLSGYPGLVETCGPSCSYDLAPRARIFRRDANTVTDLTSFQKLLRYNNYQNDPIEHHDSMWAICSRGDLSLIDPSPDGCYDTKVANLSMILNMQAFAINGPTYDNLPPFNWNDWLGYSHLGIPDLMQFDWQWMESEL